MSLFLRRVKDRIDDLRHKTYTCPCGFRGTPSELDWHVIGNMSDRTQDHYRQEER